MEPGFWKGVVIASVPSLLFWLALVILVWPI